MAVDSDAARFWKLEIEGLKEMQAAMRKAGAQADDLTKANSAVVDVLAQGAKREVPVKSGRLKTSIHGQATSSVGTLIAGSGTVPYAGPIHFGWATRGIGRGKKSSELIGSLGSKSKSRRHAAGGAFTDKALRKAASSQNRRSNAKKGVVRGGPIRPNPFLYRALDQRWDKVLDEYDRHLDAIADAFNEGRF